MERTAKLALPFLAAAQAQKHVTLNEGLRLLDTLVQAGVRSRTLEAAPAAVSDGDAFIVPEGGAGWATEPHAIVARTDGAWETLAPREGWLVHVADEATFVVFQGGRWEPLGSFSPDDLVEVPLVGIATRADGINRLAVASPASLFTHAGADHRMAINRADGADTASIVFQTGFSPRAEMGLAGEDAFSLKVSGDGADWRTALRIHPSGAVETPERPAVRAHLNGGWKETPNGETGFLTLPVERGGFALGATIGDPDDRLGQRLVVPADGLYCVIVQVFCGPSVNFRSVLRDQRGTLLAFVQINENAETTMTQSTTTLVTLGAGDTLSLHHQGPARCYHAVGHTEVSLVMV